MNPRCGSLGSISLIRWTLAQPADQPKLHLPHPGVNSGKPWTIAEAETHSALCTAAIWHPSLTERRRLGLSLAVALSTQPRNVRTPFSLHPPNPPRRWQAILPFGCRPFEPACSP